MIKMPILTKGKEMAEVITKKIFPGDKTVFPRNYEVAKKEIIIDLNKIEENISKEEDIFEEEFVITVRMFHQYIAKSYAPEQLESKRSEIVGARNFINKNEEISKLYFLKTTFEELRNLKKKLNSLKVSKEFQNTIMRVEKIDLLTSEEKVLGFEKEWTKGRVEIVLHPTAETQNLIKKLKDNLVNDFLIKRYENGPTFISVKIDLNELQILSKYNIIRTIHPLRSINLPVFRNEHSFYIPKKNFNFFPPKTKIGIFDGGVNEKCELLKGLVNQIECVEDIENTEDIFHGTIVSSAALYGSLDLNKKEITECPKVGIEHFRVFPIKNLDYDLYEIIDIVEKIVPEYKNIKVYNISFGPPGPILDDSISRFTYSLDKLAYEEDVLFTVAVGNDGQNILNRIQAPSDLVNGLGVGAYTYDETGLKRAPYSCIGEGREGSKVKPDLLAFGGCNNHPFYGISSTGNGSELVAGTSFASPIVAGLAGKMLSMSEDLTPQTIKSLLILNSIGPKSKENGFGFIEKNEEEILNCSEKEVVILYNGKIEPKKYIKLKIPYPKIEYKGNVKIEFVISMATPINPYDTDGYTSNCIEDTFYPHKDKYEFFKGKTKKTINIEDNKELIEELLQNGFTKPKFPKSRSGEMYKTEKERRQEFKWDTVVKREFSLKGNSLKNPFIILHAMERNIKENNQPIIYALSVKIKVKKYSGNLYSDIRTQYPNLLPLRVKEQITNRIKI